eukprot:jgi/Mesen1/1465/ME000132S00408
MLLLWLLLHFLLQEEVQEEQEEQEQEEKELGSAGRKGDEAMLHVALVASCLHLLPAVVAADWDDIAAVMLAHAKVAIFADVTVDAVRKSMEMLQHALAPLCAATAPAGEAAAAAAAHEGGLTSQEAGAGTGPGATARALALARQCEASLQALLCLCQPDDFRQFLALHKEVCAGGGLARLLLAVLQLPSPPPDAPPLAPIAACVSRTKAAALSLVAIFADVTVDAVRKSMEMLQHALAPLCAATAPAGEAAAAAAAHEGGLTSQEAGAGTGPGATARALALARQCEASLQALLCLCQPDDFRQFLALHKEVCAGGGLARLLLAVLQLPSPPPDAPPLAPIAACVSRTKAAALSLVLPSRHCPKE